MQKVCKLALAVLGISCTAFAQDPAANVNTANSGNSKAPAASSAPKSEISASSSAERNIRFQFDGIPYMDLVERFAQMANKPLLAETNVQGTVTFNDPLPYNFA